MVRNRLRLEIRGTVQGVGFRPFVHRLASDLGLAGWVRNGPAGVSCEAEGPRDALETFRRRLPLEKPSRAEFASIGEAWIAPRGGAAFEILPSEQDAPAEARLPPDAAPCADCLRELRDPADRRRRHPFINCTACGPRYSILEALPWDRSRTTMAGFAPCDRCRREYEDPADRRFHAEPVACPACGPSLALRDPRGARLAAGDDALARAGQALRDGRTVAVKGVGGFHLMVRARDEAALRRLRERKAREEKPFAVLVRDLAAACALVVMEPQEAAWLAEPGAPIVLARRRDDRLAPAVAPGRPQLGLFLPPSPLHQLLADDLDEPLVATSGNLSDEPICIDDAEALERLHGIADLFLVHDRRIVRPLDDSVVRLIDGGPCFLRRGRGYAPYDLPLDAPLPPALAVGAQLKGCVAVSDGARIRVGPHLGDLSSEPGFASFRRAAEDLPRLSGLVPDTIIHDLHPDYRSTRWAQDDGRPPAGVQHHHAHLHAALAEHRLEPPVLGVVWDGTGWGPDGTVWGGEFLRAEPGGIRRAGHLRRFRLPGGEAAVREPRRAALGALVELFGPDAPPAPGFEAPELALLLDLLRKGLRSPWTSSAGRLFDAAAALCGLRERTGYEGQAAMELEAAVDPAETGRYPIGRDGDWGPLLRGLIEDRARGESAGLCAARFHRGMAELIVDVAAREGLRDVVLTGGCFQNRVLAEAAARRLREEGFRPRLHRVVPPNDGGIAAGQIASLRRKEAPCA
jgi:hydrogenase maturation protein HypF